MQRFDVLIFTGYQSKALSYAFFNERALNKVNNERFINDSFRIYHGAWPRQYGGPFYNADLVGLHRIYSRIWFYHSEYGDYIFNFSWIVLCIWWPLGFTGLLKKIDS